MSVIEVTRFSAPQRMPRCCAESSGLPTPGALTVGAPGAPQLIDSVLPKSPDGAIWATVRSSMNMTSRYGRSAGLIS